MRRIDALQVLAVCMLWLLAGAFAAPASAAEGTASRTPTRAERQFEDGLQLASQGQTDAAIKVFKQLTRDYPALPQPYIQLAAMYGRNGELQLAIAALQQALRLESDDSNVQERLGDLYVQLAQRAYAAAVARDPARTSAKQKHGALIPLTASAH